MDDALLAWGDAETERRRGEASASAARSREQAGLIAELEGKEEATAALREQRVLRAMRERGR